MYQPDAIGAYRAKGKRYLVTANEGDPREFEELRAEDLVDHVENDLHQNPETSSRTTMLATSLTGPNWAGSR